jgi:hypothetical protein
MPAGLAFRYRVDMLPTRRVKAYKACSDKVVSVARKSPSRRHPLKSPRPGSLVGDVCCVEKGCRPLPTIAPPGQHTIPGREWSAPQVSNVLKQAEA